MQKTFWSFDDNVKSSVITEKDNTTKCEILLTFDPSEDYDHLKLACKPIFQKINTLYEKASIEAEGKHFDLDILMGGDMQFLQLVLGCLLHLSHILLK
jgi:hypothetical protein